MNYQNIQYAAGCKNCRRQNVFIITFMSEEDNEPLSRTDLLEEIDLSKIVCADCGRRGFMKILFFKINDLIYDMENPPKDGFITLEAKKSNGKIMGGILRPSLDGFGSYDCLNSLNIIEERLASFHNNWLLNENRNPNNF